MNHSVTDQVTDVGPSDHVLSTIKTLIAFPTVSRDSNLGLIEWVRDYLLKHGVKSRLTYDSNCKKANLFATLGEGKRPGLILSGHTDVVPVDGQAWSIDPFMPVVKDGKLYGRGTADMKSFIGTALALTPEFLNSESDSAIHFAFSYDEEVGCIGVRSLIRDLEEIGLKPAGCIVGEPTSMQPIIGHKGGNRFRCCVTGREAHSSYTNLGVNAIEYAARMVVYIRQLADRMQQIEQRNFAFTVPYTTLQTGMIRGGVAVNIVPKDCEFVFECRTLPGVDIDAIYEEINQYAKTLLPSMQAIDPSATIQIERIVSSPGLLMQEDDELVKLASALSGSKPNGAVSYGTEAGLFQKAGIPTVICGPGNIEQAHRPDEFASLAQIGECESFLRKIAQCIGQPTTNKAAA